MIVYWIVFSGLVIFIASLILNSALTFRFVWKSSDSVLRRLVQNGLIVLFSLGISLLLLELFFVFFAQSDAFNHTLAAQNWMQKYWRLNSLGYRDHEWTPAMLEDRSKVMVLGDSFVAGHGIENPADRFSDVLGEMLGDDYVVMNVGLPGAETNSELEFARKYPYQPDILVLSIYVNDIAETAAGMGHIQPLFVQPSPPIVENSYAANFFYWRMYRLGLREWSGDYWGWLKGLYEEPGIWRSYRSLLEDLVVSTRENNVELVVVVFPNLLAIEESRPITSKIVEVFRERDVPVVDVTALVSGADPQDLVASPVDWHANEAVHHWVAEALFPIIRDLKQPLD